MITRSYNNERDIEALFKEINGNLDNTSIKPNAGIEMSKTATATTQGKTAMYVQNITTDSLTNNQVIYRGWGVTGNIGAATGTVTITLPNGGYDNTDYDVFCRYLGEKTTGAPANRLDLNQYALASIAIEDSALPRSTTQFRIYLQRSAGLFPYVAFSWMTIGTKA